MHQANDGHPTPLPSQALLMSVLLMLVATMPTPTNIDRPASLAPGLHQELQLDAPLTGPHVLHGDIADVIVRVDGSETCTGTPITGTPHVVTAAHCVLDRNGNVTPITVRRNENEYTAIAVLVDTRYHNTPLPELDGAVLVMSKVLPGPSATLGHGLDRRGLVTLAGFQPIDTDGTLLRGTNPRNRPLPAHATGGYIKIGTAAAGCEERSTSVEVTAHRLTIRCGLIPGASGGGLFAERHGELLLIGVTSTVTNDLSTNGLVPIANIQKLLNDAVTNTYPIPVAVPDHATTRIERS